MRANFKVKKAIYKKLNYNSFNLFINILIKVYKVSLKGQLIKYFN
jgi:hypothetical protein